MGVIHKLRDDVVHFIISQRKENPLFSCRQLAESASEKFGLRLSKSSVHDVLKESGIVSPRGRKPTNKFQIPQEKKKQIQESLSQVKLIPDPVVPPLSSSLQEVVHVSDTQISEDKNIVVPERSQEYPGAGKIFLKAALWDLGIYAEENLKETDWAYYLTYVKGVKISLEDSTTIFIELPLPIERCVREVADGLLNNIRPFITPPFSQEESFKAFMEGKGGSKMKKISIVDQKDHDLVEFGDIIDINRRFLVKNRLFVEIKEFNVTRRARELFFGQTIEDKEFIEKIVALKGFDEILQDELKVTLLVSEDFEKSALQQAINRLNAMGLYDDQSRLVHVEIGPI